MKQPGDVLKSWMTAINRGDVESILSLYDEAAVFIPTFSSRLINPRERLQEYFETLASREELSIALHEKTLIVQSLQNDLHALFGIYCWRFAVDGELLSFEARFSYIVDLKLPRPIIHHHSSQIPRVL